MALADDIMQSFVNFGLNRNEFKSEVYSRLMLMDESSLMNAAGLIERLQYKMRDV